MILLFDELETQDVIEVYPNINAQAHYSVVAAGCGKLGIVSLNPGTGDNTAPITIRIRKKKPI